MNNEVLPEDTLFLKKNLNWKPDKKNFMFLLASTTTQFMMQYKIYISYFLPRLKK